MKRYRLVETSIINNRTQQMLKEGMFAGLTGKRVKMDWNKVEHELGSKVPDKIKQKYESLYGSTSFKMMQYLSLVMILGGAIGATMLLRQWLTGHAIGTDAGSMAMFALLASVVVSFLLHSAINLVHKAKIDIVIANYTKVKGINSNETRDKLQKAWELMSESAEGTGQTVSGIRWVITVLIIMTAAILAIVIHSGYMPIPEGAIVVKI